MTGNQSLSSTTDKIKWLVIFLLIAGGVTANQYYSEQAFSLRLIGWLVLAAVLVGIAASTAKGKVARSFIGEARIELRKVVWPTRQETIQTTFIVMIMVLIVALFLWGVDSLLLVIMRSLVG
jgi:preprotein translocase subunit SecE